MPRLFTGTLLDISEQKRVADLFEELKASAPEFSCDESKIRLTRIENLHMTWAFIGDVLEGSVAILETALAEKMNSIQQKHLPTEVAFDSVEFWPNEQAPTLIVLTPSTKPQVLLDAFEIINKTIEPFRLNSERLPFRPHITLARLKKELAFKDVSKTVLKSYLPLLLRLTDIGLFESLSEDRQIVYRPVAKFEL